MKYAIEELKKIKKYYPLQEREIISKDIDALERKQIHIFSDLTVNELEELSERVYAGLDSWGDNFLDARKRQEKKLKQVHEALRFMEGSSSVTECLLDVLKLVRK